GELRAEILDDRGDVIAPFTAANCQPVQADKTLAKVAWKGVEGMEAVAGKPVRFRFTVQKDHLFAFWVNREATGASDGFVAAGGPGLVGMRDTAGGTRLSKPSG